MKDLQELILANRPKLSEGSVKTYVNCLKNLFSSVYPKTDFNYKLFFADQKKVLDYLNTVKFNVRKTILSALVVISQNEKPEILKAYRDQMIEDSQKYKVQESEHKMTDSMKENWIDWTDILEILNKLKSKVYWIFKEDKPSKDNLLELQKYIILCCYCMIEPRRSQDYCVMKVKNYDEKKDNYYKKGTFHYINYKTSKTYGLQTMKCPKPFEMLLNKWIKIKQQTVPESDYLFSDWFDRPLCATGMAKILNSIFKKNVSVNILRHSYLTHTVGPELKKLQETAKNMGHSMVEQALYIKDIPKIKVNLQKSITV